MERLCESYTDQTIQASRSYTSTLIKAPIAVTEMTEFFHCTLNYVKLMMLLGSDHLEPHIAIRRDTMHTVSLQTECIMSTITTLLWSLKSKLRAYITRQFLTPSINL